VFAEHGQRRRAERAAGVGQDQRLLRVRVRRQVAGEQDRIDLLGDGGEGGGDLVALRLAAVRVADGGDSCWALGRLGERHPARCFSRHRHAAPSVSRRNGC
jgi:hypothetical protein